MNLFSELTRDPGEFLLSNLGNIALFGRNQSSDWKLKAEMCCFEEHHRTVPIDCGFKFTKCILFPNPVRRGDILCPTGGLDASSHGTFHKSFVSVDSTKHSALH